MVVLAYKRGSLCKSLNITHNYLIVLLSSHVLVHFLIISRSTDIIFGSIEILRKEVRLFWGSVGHRGRYGLWKGNSLKILKNHSQLLNIYIFNKFLVHFLIISRSTEIRFYDIGDFQWEVRFLGGECQTLRQICPVSGKSIAQFRKLLTTT